MSRQNLSFSCFRSGYGSTHLKEGLRGFCFCYDIRVMLLRQQCVGKFLSQVISDDDEEFHHRLVFLSFINTSDDGHLMEMNKRLILTMKNNGVTTTTTKPQDRGQQLSKSEWSEHMLTCKEIATFDFFYLKKPEEKKITESWFWIKIWIKNWTKQIHFWNSWWVIPPEINN